MVLFILFFILGLIVGSFLNCVIYRLEKKESFLSGRSYCPHCHHSLCWEDLIPVLSFLTLEGKCRYCQKPISWQYPLVELATGILFAAIFSQSIFNLQSTIYNLIIACFLIIIFVFDFKHYIIPDKVIYPAIVISLIFNFQFSISNKLQPLGENPLSLALFIYSILSALGAAAFFLAIILISRGQWMGWGDVKLAFFMGLFLGFPNILVALFSAFFIGAVVGLILIALNKKTLKSEVPFGPFLVGGTFLALFFGQYFINSYLSLFFF